MLNGITSVAAIFQLDFKPEFLSGHHSKSESRRSKSKATKIMKSLLIFSTLLVCALAYRVVPNMNHGSIKPDYLAKCVNASIVAIESYDMDGNNGLSYEEIKDVSFGAKIQRPIF